MNKEENRDVADTKRFLHKYEAQANQSNRMYAKRLPINYCDWKGDIPFHQEVQKEPYIEIYIPQDKFKQLVYSERYIQELEQEVQHFKGIASKHITDAKVRESNPVVKKAWEKYLTLLELVRK